MIDKNYQLIQSFSTGHCIYLDREYKRYIVYDKEDEFLHAFGTQREASAYVLNGFSIPPDLKNLNTIPKVGIATYKRKGQRNYYVDDVVYSTKKGKWIIKASWYNNSFDEGRKNFDEEEWFEEDED